MTDLTKKKCAPCEGGVVPMSDEQVEQNLSDVADWTHEDGHLVRTFTFRNYYETMAFVNALAWVAHREDHHPDIEVGYKTCAVRYRTHSIDGISDNDFICAAKINALLE